MFIGICIGFILAIAIGSALTPPCEHKELESVLRCKGCHKRMHELPKDL